MLTPANDKERRVRRYRFIVGVSLAALDDELDRVAGEDEEVALAQVFYAPGTGFVAVLERREHPPHEYASHPDRVGDERERGDRERSERARGDRDHADRDQADRERADRAEASPRRKNAPYTSSPPRKKG
jgi:hypothetical protein